MRDIKWYSKISEDLNITKFNKKTLDSINEKIGKLLNENCIDKDEVMKLISARELIYDKIKKQNKLLHDVFKAALKTLKNKDIIAQMKGTGRNPDDLYSKVEAFAAFPERFKLRIKKQEGYFKLFNNAVRKGQKNRRQSYHNIIVNSAALGQQKFTDRVVMQLDWVVSALPQGTIRIGLQQKVLVYAMYFVLALSAVQGINAKGVSFGVKDTFAAEVQQYKSVDEILATIQNKVFVNKDTYMDEVRKSKKAVVFFYESHDVNGPNGRLAKIYVQTIIQYPNIKLICYDHDKENMSNRYYLDTFGFKGTPHTIIFINGKNIFEDEGAPKEENIQKAIKTWNNNFQEVSKM